MTTTTRRACERLLDGLDLPASFTAATLCATLSDQRQRPLTIELHKFPTGGPTGVLVSVDDADRIFVEADAAPIHHDQIVFHEIGHLLHDHHLTAGGEDLAALFPHLDPDLVRRFLGRTQFNAQEEREAETIATLLTLRCRKARRPVSQRADRVESWICG